MAAVIVPGRVRGDLLPGEDRIAETRADAVIQASTDLDGTEREPMRRAEVRLTPGVAATRQGELEQAIRHAERALSGERAASGLG